MKKVLYLLLCTALLVGSAFGGGSGDSASSASGDTEMDSVLKVGMVTDAGTIDDKSFNQGTWEGIQKASSEGIADSKYLKPSGTTEADYIKEISNLYDAGYRFIITPGFKFETAIFTAQDKYPDAKFVLIDGYPHSGDWKEVIGSNTVSIFFAEHQAGFFAGIATALQLKEAEAGFIGGMEIPAVQKFNWGFQQGLEYANENLGTSIKIKKEHIIYQGSFDNAAAGQQLAASMYDKGVDVVFCAAGGVGVGAINEAKARAKRGEDVWLVGVDVDQYSHGIYDGDRSVILTSAVKYVGVASYGMVQSEINGEFPGGRKIVLDVTNGGVGIPPSNPNLDSSVESKVADMIESFKNGSIDIKDSMNW